MESICLSVPSTVPISVSTFTLEPKREKKGVVRVTSPLCSVNEYLRHGFKQLCNKVFLFQHGYRNYYEQNKTTMLRRVKTKWAIAKSGSIKLKLSE